MSMNLLPWRTYQHQKRLRRLAFLYRFIYLACYQFNIGF